MPKYRCAYAYDVACYYDLGRIPSAQDWLCCIKPEPWMGRTQKLEDETYEQPRK